MKSWLHANITAVAKFLGLDFWITAWAGLAAIVLLLALVIVLIVVAVKRKSAGDEEPTGVTEVKTESAAETVAAEPVKTEPVKEEPKAEEKAVKEEIKEPAKVKEEKPAVKPAAKKEKAAKPAEKPAAKPAAKPTAKKPAASAKAKVLGKWVVERKSDDEYISVLFASNGEIMLTSETYVSEDGARKGVATIIKAVEADGFVVYKTKNGNYYFKVKSAANRLLCAGEMYKDKAGCESAVESVKRIAADSPVIEEVSEGEKYYAYTPVELTDAELKGAAKGKWKIEKTEDGKYYATLYASNGQVMISTEEVSSKPTAVAGMENAKKNAILGNFVIDKDKFGKYYYKLRNAAKSVICVGESYPSAARCISALESVRKFAANSPIVE